MIRILNLTKKFRTKDQEIVALDAVNLEVESGEVYGLLGPNGAGKTTLFRVLCCLLRPTSGSAEVSGNDVSKDSQKVRQKVGLLCEEPSLYDKQTVHDNLAFFGELYGLERSNIEKRIAEISKTLQFTELVQRKAGTLSKGQRQRVSIARALLHEPEVLLLDEPTANLDPQTANDVRNAIKNIQGEDHNRTIIVSSHNLNEIERMCGRVSIIDDGKIIKSGEVRTLEQEFSTKKIVVTFSGTVGDEFKLSIRGSPGVVEVATSSEQSILEVASAQDVAHQTWEILLEPSTPTKRREEITSEIVRIMAASKDCRIVSVSSPEWSLEQVYLKLMREAADDQKENESLTEK